MRRFFLFVCAVFVIFSPAVSHAGILEFLFPSLREEEYDPTKEMVAEFAAGQGAEEKEKLDALPEGDVELSKPHRLSKDIGNWLMTATGEAMNFEAGSADQQINSYSQNFDAVGRNQYIQFLREQKVLNVIQDGRFNVRSYVNGQPLLLNEGVVNDRYRWLFRVPVVVSYLDKDMKSYDGNDARLVQKADINIQIGRIKAEDKADGLQIEQWNGKMEPMEEIVDTIQ